MNNIDLNDKVAVVTGGAQGFGLAIAKRISESGANVVIWDKDEEILKQVKLRNSFNLTVDVTSFENVSKAVETTLNQYRKIDILVNNAGFVIYGKVSELTIEEIESQMETNYFGMIYCTKNFLSHMIEQGQGHIVNVASVGASLGVPGFASYCATKFAMLGFSEGLKHELSGTGVDVTVVSPIMVDTPLFDHPSFENFSRHSTIAILSPEKVANTILKAANSSRLEIVVPSVARAGIWAKQNFPFLINPIIGNAFRKQLTKRTSKK